MSIGLTMTNTKDGKLSERDKSVARHQEEIDAASTQGALSGAAQGASAGSAFGPIGMVIGAVAGAGRGAIQGDLMAQKEFLDADRAAAESKERAKKASLDAASDKAAILRSDAKTPLPKSVAYMDRADSDATLPPAMMTSWDAYKGVR